MITARFSSNNLLWLDDAYEAMFPERRTHWRHPWRCAVDLLKRKPEMIVSCLGGARTFKVMWSILKEVPFPNEDVRKECRVRATAVLYFLFRYLEEERRGMHTKKQLPAASGKPEILEECAPRAQT